MEQTPRMAALQDDLTALIQAHRIGHLATADATGAPHLVPICFVYTGQVLYSAIDHKPKRRTGYRMKRIRNIVENPRVAFLVHHYAEEWQQLYYVLMRGPASILETGQERQRALGLLEAKYPQYQERQLAQSDGLVIKMVPESVQRWGWQESSTPMLA
ncbi:MAG: TIGR03668 family PPOX class F420-dependent oxidoreductase [Candidatus Tectomicrobia bacterium]|uniref:TIGR03668 family PPOX class F420-dependent oxidoreductase n=1 Tax=Tectimicrobiota bacterium TaxID=2528274 RepID=A0A937VZI0_UNCTE|nr:TIGR03668 family PPOX class F420-dependent oxidoreductase [Candidatus Tectomicrobia bacterium]